MELYRVGECIECLAAHVTAKWVDSSIIMKHPIIGRVIKYNCQRDGFAEITKELNPKEPILISFSKLNKGDSINANTFYVLVKGTVPLRLKKVHFSGAHNAQEMYPSDYTYAQVIVAFPGKGALKLPADYISPFKQLTKK
jgi:hypothetical protein